LPEKVHPFVTKAEKETTAGTTAAGREGGQKRVKKIAATSVPDARVPGNGMMEYAPKQDFGPYFVQLLPVRYTANIGFALKVSANNTQRG
jgi:hypothetical protein